jgi:threonine dehydrogenase-like Zn-dependent dehydrogenase
MTMAALYFAGVQQLEWREAPLPTLSGPGEALVRPLAVAACDLDLGIVSGRSPFPAPFPMGHEFAAEIVELGDEVRAFTVGDVVAVAFQPSCGGCGPCRRGHSAACVVVPGTPMYGIGAAGGDWGGALADLVRVPFAEAMMVRLPDGATPAMAAGASDNIADGYRTVAGALQERPGAAVLIAGSGSIALYAAWWARTLGAAEVTLCSRDGRLLSRAAPFEVAVEQVTAWPKRFRTHPITVDCTGEAAGLAAVIRSTEAFGHCTSASIYFGGEVSVPMFDMNMKGIRFDTGRVNASALLPEVLALIARHRLTPESVGATVTGWTGMPDALLDGAFKPIAVRPAA